MSHHYNDPSPASSSYLPPPRSPPLPPRMHDRAHPSHPQPNTPPAHYHRPAASIYQSHTYPPVKIESPPADTDARAAHTHHPQFLPSASPTSTSNNPSHAPPYRFGSSANSQHPLPPFSFMSQAQPTWTPSTSSPSAYQAPQHFTLPPLHPIDDSNLGSMLTMNDEYDDGDELADLPSGGLSGSVSFDVLPGTGAGSGRVDKVVRRRSSKACDQCRKSKCKCERSSEHEPCKSCIMLGTPCTFLGPSRKRGPPKGYIDAIEARLHQTEALVGIMLAANDVRAKTLLDDLRQDSLARDIIERVDNSPYGVKGRSRGAGAAGSKETAKTKAHALSQSQSQSQSQDRDGSEGSSTPPLQNTHPSNHWQDELAGKLNALALSRKQNAWAPGDSPSSPVAEGSAADEQRARTGRPSLSIVPPADADRSLSPSRRQRRRVEAGSRSAHPSVASSGRSGSHSRSPRYGYGSASNSPDGTHVQTTPDAMDGSSENEELAGEVGQLSLNEEREVRYHSKASGLHLLGVKDRVDGRNEGGIWRFPKARVWPPLPGGHYGRGEIRDDEEAVALPPLQTQERLLDLYFTFVHPALPIVHKQTFMEDFRNGHIAVGASPGSNGSDGQSPRSSTSFQRRRAYIPPLLLLVMFSIAARYTTRDDAEVPPPPEGEMWPAGDAYLDVAKVLLNKTYASSRPSTCQALLLMGYREIGIGAMAQAWLYVGMAVRMAQDLGIHKSADRWQHVGASLFSPVELQERRRIWYACVIMDKYVSTYIGRPIAIYERDFDIELPSVDEPEELEDWNSKPSTDPIGHDPGHSDDKIPPVKPIIVPGHIVSCFNASATLSILLSKMMQAIYAVRSGPGRHAESLRIEEQVDKWYLDLPDHLRFDPNTFKKSIPPPPHILTLHMQYWTVVILLHRPFIRYVLEMKSKGSPREDSEVRAISQKNYDLCVQAANTITSIVSIYREYYCIKRSSVFLCFYVFTAGIMHVNTLNVYASDPQARMGLTTCMDVLRSMSIIWPAAGRAWELLTGSKVNISGAKMEMSNLVSGVAPRKRSAEHFLEDSHFFAGAPPPAHRTSIPGPGYPLPSLAPPAASSGPPQGNNGMPYYTSYDRWPENSMGGYTGLSTSVLPQQYSTGFVDERARASHGDSTSSGAHGQRYPRYWSDYSTLNQLSSPYGVPLLADEPTHPPGQSHSSPHVYLPADQYQMYNNIPPSH